MDKVQDFTGGMQDVPVLKVAIFIVDWRKIKTVSTIFSQSGLRYHFVCKGRGTASSEILDILGIGSSDKAVIISLEQDLMVPVLMLEVGKKLGLNHPGTGIGFSIPLSAVNNPVLTSLRKDAAEPADSESTGTLPRPPAGQRSAPRQRPEGGLLPRSGPSVQAGLPDVQNGYSGEEGVKMERKYDLIITILNQGYSDEFMTAAREAGAGGGTVISARGLLKTGSAKIFGISIQNEKEIILILTTREKKAPIMEAVGKSHGISSKAEGIIFSVPAGNIIGIDLG